MKYFIKQINDKEYNFRITSADIAEIEKKNNQGIQEYLMESFRFDKCVNLLRYLRKSSVPNFSINDAQNFMDELVDNGYSLEQVYLDIIFPACVESGILTERDLNKIMEAITEQHNKNLSDTPK